VLAALASPHLLGPSPLRDILLVYARAIGLINLGFSSGRPSAGLKGATAGAKRPSVRESLSARSVSRRQRSPGQSGTIRVTTAGWPGSHCPTR
jgi:hypothetical protein